MGVGLGVGVGVGFWVGLAVGVGSCVAVVSWTTACAVVGVGVGVVATWVLPYTEAEQIQRRSAAIIVPHPRPIFALRDSLLNQRLKPDGLLGGL